ncbi:hypothetical protein PUN28_017215 [Cardiocondyla obscurior]|uniref:Uncharacterized protein n=1 Tax=Cardiocondyla obscurior TaxID=286306 RepID=A0AAW2EPI6_9HYME
MKPISLSFVLSHIFMRLRILREEITRVASKRRSSRSRRNTSLFPSRGRIGVAARIRQIDASLEAIPRNCAPRTVVGEECVLPRWQNTSLSFRGSNSSFINLSLLGAEQKIFFVFYFFYLKH